MRSPSRSASSRSWVMKTMVFLQPRLQFHQLVLHLAADQRIEGRKRLVHQQDFGIGAERPRQADALLHAAGELRRILVLVAGKADGRDPLGGRRLALRPAARRGPPGRRRRSGGPCDGETGRSAGTPSPVFWRRKASRSRIDSVRMSTPSMTISPSVGSISRLRWRISVDLPEPDRPITTKISPRSTDRETSWRPTRVAGFGEDLVLARRPPSGARAPAPACGPKILVTCLDLDQRHGVSSPPRDRPAAGGRRPG